MPRHTPKTGSKQRSVLFGAGRFTLHWHYLFFLTNAVFEAVYNLRGIYAAVLRTKRCCHQAPCVSQHKEPLHQRRQSLCTRAQSTQKQKTQNRHKTLICVLVSSRQCLFKVQQFFSSCKSSFSDKLVELFAVTISRGC